MRTQAKLTDQIVAAIEPGGRVYDTNLRGFFCERGVSPTGKPSFRVHADPPSKSGLPRSLMRTVGRAGQGPGELSAKAARGIAQKMIGDIKAGIDPAGKPSSGPSGGPTLREAWTDYQDVMRKRRYSERSLDANEASFARLAQWHDLPCAAIASNLPGIKRMHDTLTKRSGPRAANASLSFAGTVHTYARESQYVPGNVGVICRRCNMRKSDSDASALFSLGMYTQGLIANPDRVVDPSLGAHARAILGGVALPPDAVGLMDGRDS